MSKTEKKKMNKGTKALLIIVCVLVGLALLLAATVFVLNAVGKSTLTGDDTMKLPDTSASNFESLDSGTIRRNGKLYRYNDEITCILLMGIDSYNKQEETTLRTSRMSMSLRSLTRKTPSSRCCLSPVTRCASSISLTITAT